MLMLILRCDDDVPVRVRVSVRVRVGVRMQHQCRRDHRQHTHHHDGGGISASSSINTGIMIEMTPFMMTSSISTGNIPSIVREADDHGDGDADESVDDLKQRKANAERR